MGRPRKTAKHLPQGMLQKHGAYYYKSRVDGVQRWSKLSRDYGEALRKYADLVGATRDPARTITDALAHYLALRHNDLKPDTRAGYAQSARRLAPVFGHMALADLRRDHVYNYLIERGNVAANRDRALLSAMYTHLINAGVHRGTNPCAGLQFRNMERARKRYVTDGELEVIMANLPRGLSLMARWAYLTGMRESDMLALRLTQADDAGVTYVPSKARKGREPSATLIEWTDELRAVWRAAAGDRIGAQALFANRDGEHYSRDSFQSIWQRWRKKLPITDLIWHDLRRKAGSDSASDAAAMHLLEHKDGATTRKHYRVKPKIVTPLSTTPKKVTQ